VAELRKAMRNTSHNGFPITRHAPSGEVRRREGLAHAVVSRVKHSCVRHGVRLSLQVQVVVGLVVRDHIMVLLRQALGRGSARAVDASWEELNRRYVSTEGQRLVSEQQLAVLQVRIFSAPQESIQTP